MENNEIFFVKKALAAIEKATYDYLKNEKEKTLKYYLFSDSFEQIGYYPHDILERSDVYESFKYFSFFLQNI